MTPMAFLEKIADMVGFHSVHYFTTVYRKQLGMPPGEWRKKELIGIGKDILFEEDVYEFTGLNCIGSLEIVPSRKSYLQIILCGFKDWFTAVVRFH